MGPEHACSGLSLFALRTSIQTWFGHSNCSFTVNTYVYSSKIPHTLNAILRGDSVTYDNAEKLAKYLGYSVCELFTVEDKFKPLSDKTILEHHRLASMILALAEKEQLIPYNPAAKATPPKVAKKEADYYQPEEVAEILKALENAPVKWKAMTYILIDTGCRRGELMGLQWKCIDMDKDVMMIKQALL